jgi:hypothetical protein
MKDKNKLKKLVEVNNVNDFNKKKNQWGWKVIDIK